MELRRSRVIAAAILLGLVGAIVPIVSMVYVSWVIAVDKQQEVLQQISRQTIVRASKTFADARIALDSLAYPPLPPCSPQHIARMRVIDFNTTSVAEIGYFENGVLKCSSWGLEETKIIRSVPDYVTPDGLQVKIDAHPAISMGNRVMAIYRGVYGMLIDPQRFVDTMMEDGVSLVLANEAGDTLVTLNAPDAALLKSVAEAPQRGMNQRSLYAVTRENGLVAMAIAPRASIAGKLEEELLLLVPAGAFVAIFIVVFVAWQSKKRLSPLGELSIAVRKREFIVHYQPIVDLTSGACVGAEALVRWRRPDGSLTRPDLFIPLAEESGLIMPITDQVIEMVAAEFGPLLNADPDLHVAINLCASDVTSGRVLPVLEENLGRHGIDPHQVWLEATERGFMDIDAARETLKIARAWGHTIAIDDFGTGYSSLQYLEGLPTDALKIDKSFIDTIGRNTATSSVTPHIIEMAKTLDLKIVAEGVETQEQADYLREHGVDYGQGWLYSKALPMSGFLDFYRKAKTRQNGGASNIRVVAA
jgi:sensor c-di-GMP phosphodiesterase-like protein